MYLRSLFLKNYRAYQEQKFEFAPGVNSIIGPNACGKTTLLEAVYTLMMGRSFRTAQKQELIRQGEEAFYLEAVFVRHGVEQTLKIAYDGKARRIQHNQTPLQSISALFGLLRGACMTPDDVRLIKGGPALRREFLDMQLAQADSLYVHHLSRYIRAMKQRNQCLRDKALQTIETWEEEMAKSAKHIVSARKKAAFELEEIGKELYGKISPSGEEVSIYYQMSNIEDETCYREQMQRMRKRELLIGTTLVGPHRDNLLIHLDKKEARYFASEGQQRSLAAVLRLAEWERLRRQSEQTPIMLLDDIGISLDAVRRERLFSLVSSCKQVFLTGTEEGSFARSEKCLQISRHSSVQMG